jgi:SulP family sulfate permease
LPFSFELAESLLIAAFAIAMLGAIESLLSAVVADGMTGRRHRSNCELVAQGIGNIGSVAFGGMCATGTIARTATNVRAGAHGPISGMLHALYLLGFMLVAAPLAAYIPLASLGSVLALVAWNMAEKHEFWQLLRSSWGDATVLMATFLLTIFEDLTIAIAVGVTLGALLFLHRMAEAVEVNGEGSIVSADQADARGVDRRIYEPGADGKDVLVYRISGALFFGAASGVGSILDRIGEHPRVFILDFSGVPLVDSTGAKLLQTFVEKLDRSGTSVAFVGASRTVRRTLLQAGLRKPLVRYARTVADALDQARAAGTTEDDKKNQGNSL